MDIPRLALYSARVFPLLPRAYPVLCLILRFLRPRNPLLPRWMNDPLIDMGLFSL